MSRTTDYYKILGISEKADAETIKHAYRKLALKFHPDHNPDDPHAEERFKEISEAYGVLIDPLKRAEYDRSRSTRQFRNYRTYTQQQGFGYKTEDIYRDIFNNPRFNDVFSELAREFRARGFRFDESFIRQVFFGGKGFVFGGFFFGTPFGRTLRTGKAWPTSDQFKASSRAVSRTNREQVTFKKIARKALNFVSQKISPKSSASHQGSSDIYLNLPLTPDVIKYGKKIEIKFKRNNKMEHLRVTIPRGIAPGKKIRIAGMGNTSRAGKGDLYLTVQINPQS